MFDESSALSIIDDTKPLTAIISETENNGSYILYEIKVHRGANCDVTWSVQHRYSDFAALNSTLQGWGVGDLPFPKKKIFGNLDRGFVEDRKKALQVYLDVVLQNTLLSGTLDVKKFLDPSHYDDNFEEEALRQTSMLLRAEPHWKMIEPLKNIGHRIKRSFFLVNCETEVVGKQILSWTEIGPYYSFSGKEMSSLTKLLTTVQHPYITPVTMAAFNQSGVHVSRPFHTAGSLRDILCAAKPKSPFFKKYMGQRTILPENEIAVAGRNLLEALVFLQDRGLPYGHLHSGNIMVDTTSNGNIYKLSDIENFLLGLPSRHRNLHVQHGGIKTTLDADVYNFGLVLYEMSTGTVQQTPTTDMIPATIPPAIRTILESILSTSAQRDGIPTLDDLIADIFFTPTTSSTHVQPVLKLSNKHKQAISIATTCYETALTNDHKSVNQLRQKTKALQRSMTDEKKKRRKRPTRENSMNKDRNQVTAAPPPAAPNAPTAPAAPPAPTAPKAPPAPAAPSAPASTPVTPLPTIEDVKITMFGKSYSYSDFNDR
ncbi:PX domain-containing protein kinase-like protein isoform X2 [Bolinopsis microptera]|uniref:PX domain-containing protein kinase-like protein isoform X2 n=1 Tax=Bolinopsis microptera TaxID=2820187 RepID=UPI00307A7972